MLVGVGVGEENGVNVGAGVRDGDEVARLTTDVGGKCVGALADCLPEGLHPNRLTVISKSTNQTGRFTALIIAFFYGRGRNSQ